MLMREYSLMIPVIFTGGVCLTYFSLPIVKEAAREAQELVYQVAEVIPGIDLQPVQQGGPVNHAVDAYKAKLDSDMKNFMADIDRDKAEVVELQDLKHVNKSAKFHPDDDDEHQRLL
ncbi:hypothetical protein HDU91_005193 [Kappamyces sp. JEL0680]|nr:hypothetical protein HDU91_005193 [Kappamyces sp. JEL0680]